ncbi:efflux RND transporter periplasmic adaptor subunit [Ancylomarina sp. 16SWW S1-10-2]|uniref:efflux RND transporter periplasmic adaptor subunit n=1 Tax=Ancylomarina sp. 16SWW S1-10-2 TaxID=2499681 RepID=UPI0012AD96BC|nr:efflux RND transporter periplasmic adaptor subunit [Ancylomarina sp. 16SWW S1-10-2]MRT94423.1 efflux RND transporter periplasmic adaptor subunit [Ancylomarina sp. 16SWW S1-10-2]
MKLSSIWIISIAVGIVSLGTISCDSKKGETTTDEQDVKQAIPVKTAKLYIKSVTKTIEYTASLIPFEEVYLAPATPGKIKEINVEIGDHVSKGQIIASMDPTNLESARLNLINLETNFKRLDTLKKTNTIADQQYDEVKTAYEAAKVSFQFLLDNTQIKAPFDGTISGKYFENGENFSGTPNTQAGKSAIVTIVQIKQLKALVGLSEIYFPETKKGMKVDIVSNIYPDEIFKGEIYNIYPTIDNATKTFTVEVKINNSESKLRPGMFAKIELNMGKGDAILVPMIALIKQTGTDDMYLFVNENNIAIKKPVKTGRIIDDKTEIVKGIKVGDEIVVEGQNKLQNQSPITIIK